VSAENKISWYILRVLPQTERRVEAAVMDLGYQAFTPVELKMRGGRSRTGKRTRQKWEYPMFVRYSFVGVSCYEQLHHVREQLDVRMPGGMVHGVLGWREGRAPYVLKPDEVSYLQSVSGQSIRYVGSINPHRAVIPPQIGGTAEIIEGPFAGRQVKVTAIRGGKAKAMLEMFDSMQVVSIPIEHLEAV